MMAEPLLDAWHETRARRAHHPAVLDEGGTPIRTFHDIENRAGEWNARLREFRFGTVIAVQLGNDPDWPSIFLACLRRSLVVVPLDQSMSEQDRMSALKICCVSAIIARRAIGGGATKSDAFPAVTHVDSTAPSWGADPPCLLKLTSGTTAAPRAVRFRSQQLMADCEQICNTMGISDKDLNFGVIPISHSYGFSNLLTPLVVRGVPLALSSDRLPRAIVRNLERSGATVFPGMPVFYQAFAEMTDIPSLPKLRLCISAGAPLSPMVARQFREKFKLPVHSFYGSSECGGICYDRDSHVYEEGFVGPVMDAVTLEALDPAASATQVRVRSAAVGEGYFPDAAPEKLGGGTFVPDDLLTSSSRGWKIVGRISDLINVAGKKVNPAEVEAELLAVPGVREAVVFGRKSSHRNQEVAACVVADADVSETDVLKICRRRLSGWQVPKRVFMVDALPINERGKLSRRDLGLQFAGE